MIKNKKAAERYLSPWMFLIWVLIGVFIVAGVFLFYSSEADVREEESEILALRIIDCLVKDGNFNEEFLGEFDIFQECNLNKKILDEDRDFYFKISVYDDSGGLLKQLEKGEKEFFVQCNLEGKEESEGFPACSEKKIYALNLENKKLRIEILAASNQKGGRL